MIREVLVGVDFSDASRQALARGAAWAQRQDVPLRALHVLQPLTPVMPEAQVPMPDPEWLRSVESQAREHLEAWIQGLPKAAAQVRWGGPAEQLVEAATPETLLVVAQVGHSAIHNLLFGSTAARVVRHAPCDVLVVRGEEAKT